MGLSRFLLNWGSLPGRVEQAHMAAAKGVLVVCRWDCRKQKKLQQSELLQRLNEETLRQGQAREGTVAGGGRKVRAALINVLPGIDALSSW